MPENSLIKFKKSLMNTPYKNNLDYWKDQFHCIEFLLAEYVLCRKSSDLSAQRAGVLEQFSTLQAYVDSRLNACANDSEISALSFKKRGKFNNLEWFFIAVAVMYATDVNHAALLQHLDDSGCLNYNAVLKLYFLEHEVENIPDFYNLRASVVQKLKIYFEDEDKIQIHDYLFSAIASDEHQISQNGLKFRLPQPPKTSAIRAIIADNMCGFLQKNEKIFYYIHGECGIGKQHLINNVCDKLQKRLISIDCLIAEDNLKEFINLVKSACCNAIVFGSFIHFKNVEKLIHKGEFAAEYIPLIFEYACNCADCVFISGVIKANMPPKFYELNGIEIELPELNNSESVQIWQECVGSDTAFKDINFQDLANKFNLTPKQIINATKQAKNSAVWGNTPIVTNAGITEAIYNQITEKLSDKTTLIKAKYTWNDIVLPKKQKSIIMQACNQIKYKHIVYDNWGLKDSFLYGRGLSMLFSGPSGTGKTMAAQVVASELGLEIYRVDLSQVVSKWIGETEKNIGEIFDSAQRSNVVLLFDEMDALFAKRTEVTDSHDKSANLETSYLLQKIEEYSGITIMTTNFIQNIDQAFFRRISYVVNFNLPGVELRKKMWIKMYPKHAPIDKNVDFDFLANNFAIAGGNIKNVVITSTFMAAAEGTNITMSHILKALEYEITKQGKMISKSDFGKYAYLI